MATSKPTITPISDTFTSFKDNVNRISLDLGATGRLNTNVDSDAVATTHENIKLNRVKRQIFCYRNDGYPKASPNSKTKFDMIVANILSGPLFDMAYDSSRWINKGGFVILSGLLIPQERYVLGAFLSCGLRLIKRLHISGWSTIILRKPSIRKSSIL